MTQAATGTADWVIWVNVALAAFSASMAGLAGWINWWTWRRQRSADKPGISFSVTPSEDQRSASLRLEIHNRSDIRWRGVSVVVTSPRSAKIAGHRHLWKSDGAGGGDAVEPDWSTLQRATDLRCELAPMGTRSNSLIVGSGDRVWEDFRIYFGKPRRRCSIRVTLRSTEGAPRTSVTTMKTTFAKQKMAHAT